MLFNIFLVYILSLNIVGHINNKIMGSVAVLKVKNGEKHPIILFKVNLAVYLS